MTKTKQELKNSNNSIWIRITKRILDKLDDDASFEIREM